MSSPRTLTLAWPSGYHEQIGVVGVDVTPDGWAAVVAAGTESLR